MPRLWALAPALLALIIAARGDAACNAIPGPSNGFRGTLATVDRPFASPGELVRLSLDDACHASQPGFCEAGADGKCADADPQDRLVVVVAFVPVVGGQPHLAVLAPGCAALTADLDRCRAGGAVTVSCFEVDDPLEPVKVQVRGPRALVFRLPKVSDPALGLTGDLTPSGPARLAVTASGAPLACELAGSPCAPRPGVLACVDALFADDGSCAPSPHAVFDHFTALPPANDYQALCTDPSPPCRGTATDVRIAADANGNLLLAMDWAGVQVTSSDGDVAAILRGATALEAFEGRGVPLRITDLSALASFSPDGRRLAPLFDPIRTGAGADGATLLGSVDAPRTVLRIARHGGVSRECGGGPNVGLPCTEDAQCPASACAGPTCRRGGSAGPPGRLGGCSVHRTSRLPRRRVWPGSLRLRVPAPRRHRPDRAAARGMHRWASAACRVHAGLHLLGRPVRRLHRRRSRSRAPRRPAADRNTVRLRQAGADRAARPERRRRYDR